MAEERSRVMQEARRDVPGLATMIVAITATLAWAAVPAAAASDAGPVPKQPQAPVSGGDETPVPGGAPQKRDLVLEGGADGTVFRTLTIEGEDRIRIDIRRPALTLDLEPASAPGLELGGAEDVLNRTRPDLERALLDAVAMQPSPSTARPWLESLATGPAARFRPELTDVETWSLTVSDARGRTAASFEGKGRPPKEIVWDGRGRGDAEGALPGLTYSYVLEARDRAGNRRHFVGEGFEVPARRVFDGEAVTLTFAGDALARTGRTSGAARADDPFLAELATWVNQSPAAAPVTIRVHARTHGHGEALARAVHEGMRPMLVGDPARVRAHLVVESDAPAAGAVLVTTAR